MPRSRPLSPCSRDGNNKLTEKERLLEILKHTALKLGNFTLASGAKSNYYIDARLVTTHPEGAYLIGKLIFELIKKDNISAIGGPAIGAIPVCTAVSLVSHLEGQPIPAFFVRMKAKDYGLQKAVEGNFIPGSRVAIAEDVITTAKSALAAIAEVEKLGCQVVKVVCIVDREAGGREGLADAGYNLEAIFTKTDLGVSG